MTKRYYLDEELFRMIRSRVLSGKKEFGGSLKLDCKQKVATDESSAKGCVLKENETTSGGYDYVDIKRTTFADWHSHPAKCLNDEKCAVGVPSPDDMQHILEGFADVSKYHFVFADEGTYAIEPDWSHPFLTGFKGAPSATQKATAKKLNDAFEKVFQKWDKRDETYKSYRSQWLDACHQYGFRVQFFKKNRLP